MINQSPSTRFGKSHESTVGEATYEHDCWSPPFVAVIVTVSPFVVPGTVIVGVVSDVLLSVVLAPESLDAKRSGIPGVAGAVESIVMGSAALAGESIPAMLVMIAEVLQVPSARAGRVHEFVDTDFTYEHDTVVPPRVA